MKRFFWRNIYLVERKKKEFQDPTRLEEDNEIWDDSALVDAYEKAISITYVSWKYFFTKKNLDYYQTALQSTVEIDG